MLFRSNPVLNQFPSVTVGPDVFTTGGGTIAFSQTSSDPDGDPLRTATGRGAFSPSGGWMVENMARQLFPLTASAPFTAPSLARMVAVPYATSVADGRGGGASARNWAVVSPVASPGGAPSGTLTVPATASVDRKSTRLNSSHSQQSRMPSSA